ncbi:MAG: hypothetical protein J6A47_00675 [Bacilli bacterium]|nr:hypothetical protein [Bacilli bacterium]
MAEAKVSYLTAWKWCRFPHREPECQKAQTALNKSENGYHYIAAQIGTIFLEQDISQLPKPRCFGALRNRETLSFLCFQIKVARIDIILFLI